MITKSVPSDDHSQFINITRLIQEAVAESGIRSGIATVFVSHTTAGITINENADPDVTRDLLNILDRFGQRSARQWKSRLRLYCMILEIKSL